MTEQAKKYDQEKPRVDLVPFDAIEAAGEVLAFGAKKYGTWNWIAGDGLAWHQLARAALSHVGKWAMGEDNDPESGLSHLAHALCCVMFLVTYVRRGHGIDDRPKLPWFAQKGGKVASTDTIPAPAIAERVCDICCQTWGSCEMRGGKLACTPHDEPAPYSCGV